MSRDKFVLCTIINAGGQPQKINLNVGDADAVYEMVRPDANSSPVTVVAVERGSKTYHVLEGIEHLGFKKTIDIPATATGAATPNRDTRRKAKKAA